LVALPWILAADKRGVLKAVGVYFLVYICLMAPWWSYNYHQYGRFVRLDLGEGGVMAIENSKAWEETHHYTPDNALFPAGFFQKLYAPYKGLRDPVAVEEAMKRDALHYAIDSPGIFVSNSFDRFRRFFKPSFDIYPPVDAVFDCILASIYLSAAFFILRTPPALARLAPALLVIGFLAAIHSVTHSMPRYRVPVDPLLALFSACRIMVAWKLTRPINVEAAWLTWHTNARRLILLICGACACPRLSCLDVVFALMEASSRRKCVAERRPHTGNKRLMRNKVRRRKGCAYRILEGVGGPSSRVAPVA
jgi:hypothetical protein